MNQPENGLSNMTRKRNLFVDFLAILFGIGSWVGVTSAYLQLPLIVATAPEGWSLPSYLSITVQSANIVSITYVLYQKYSPKKFNDGHLIYITLCIGCIAAISMAFLYQHTIEIGGRQRSIAMLTFTFMFAVVGCLSSVLFMPYMGRFREIYLVTYLFGQGLNGSLSSVLALIQGVGGTPECIPNNSTDGPPFIKYIPPPLFGPKIYFLFVFAILLLSTIAFILLNKLSVCKNEYAAGSIANGNEYHYDNSEKTTDSYGQIPDDVRNLSSFNYTYLMIVIVGVTAIGNGILPGLQSFSSLPYGSIVYLLSATMSTISNPMACSLAMFMPHTSIRNIRILSISALIIAIYIFFVALNSPYPPLLDSVFGSILIVSKVLN